MAENKEKDFNKLSDEIDVLDILRLVWKNKTLILKISLLFGILGLIVSLLSEKTFTVDVAFIPQTSNDSGALGGQLGGLADLAGVDLGSEKQGNDFPPSLYPMLLENIDFQLKILDSPLYLDEWSDSLTYKNYYLTKYKPSVLSLIGDYTIDLPFKILDLFKDDRFSSRSSIAEEFGRFKKLQKVEKEILDVFFSQVSVNPNIKEGFVSVSMSMPDPYLAAQMANQVQLLIHDYLVEYKTQKALQELKFIEENYYQRRNDYEKAQNRLSTFQDRNLGLSTVSSKNKLRILENEYDLALQVYINLATKLEEAKLNLSKNTPLLTIIKPVTVPIRKSGPRTFLNVILWSISGIIGTIIYVFFGLTKKKLVVALNTSD